MRAARWMIVAALAWLWACGDSAERGQLPFEAPPDEEMSFNISDRDRMTPLGVPPRVPLTSSLVEREDLAFKSILLCQSARNDAMGPYFVYSFQPPLGDEGGCPGEGNLFVRFLVDPRTEVGGLEAGRIASDIETYTEADEQVVFTSATGGELIGEPSLLVTGIAKNEDVVVEMAGWRMTFVYGVGEVLIETFEVRSMEGE